MAGIFLLCILGNTRQAMAICAASASGVHYTHKTYTICPCVLWPGRGLGGGSTFIIMEHLNFSGRPSQSELGRKLAQMHLAEPSVCPLHTNTYVSILETPTPGKG